MIRTLLSSFLIFCSLLAFAAGNDGYLGISVRSMDDTADKGLLVVNVYDDGSAWLAGLMENDILTTINGTAIVNSPSFHKHLAKYQWGDRVNIGYIRNGVAGNIDVVLGSAANKKTYEILKSEQLSGEVIWYFDDNTTIVMKDNAPNSITKKSASGEKETLDLINGKFQPDQLPKRFMDLQDKLDVIAYTLEEQRLLDQDADQIIFTKEVVHESVNARLAGMESMEISSFDVYPNPSNGEFTAKIISEGSGKLSYDIYDMRGSSIESGNISDFSGIFEQQFNISSKFKGVYLLYFRLGDKKVSKQIVIN